MNISSKFLSVFILAAFLSGCIVSPSTSQAIVSSEITLEQYEDAGYGIRTVIPNGWKPSSSGVVWRKQSATDRTLIVQQSAPKSTEDLLSSLLPRLHMEEPPESIGTYASPVLAWSLYRVTVPMMAGEMIVDLGLAQSGGTSYFVFLQTTPEEHDALVKRIFQPTLEAFAPLQADAPVPYRIEEVTFENGSVTLSGTLTRPFTGGPHPAVVLVTGSGPQDRNNAMGGIAMQPFRLLADALTRAGIVVLRYDDRGVGASTGDFQAAALSDFAADASAALDYLYSRPEIDAAQIGLLGHSEGGLIAAMLGAEREDLAFIVVMGGPGLNGRELLRLQTRRRMEVEGASPAEIDAQLAFVAALSAAAGDSAAIERVVFDYSLAQAQALPEEQRAALGDLRQYARTAAEQTAREYSGGWFESFLEYDPALDWARTQAPVLAFFGGKDVQVDAAKNAPALESALERGGSADYRIVTLPDANHLFQKAHSGSFSEYRSLPAEFCPEFLPTLIDWLNEHATAAR